MHNGAEFMGSSNTTVYSNRPKNRDSTTYNLPSTIYQNGFTIVELLVVIVVIGILAAISVVSYVGISQKVTAASLQSDLFNASKQLKIDQVINSKYPDSVAAANNGKGLLASRDTTYQYSVDNSSGPQRFCITATKNAITYKITSDGNPVLGDCQDYGLVLKLDANSLVSYSGSGITWADLSGNNNNATMYNGVTYSSSDGGIMTFDGTNDYATITNNASLNFSTGQTAMLIMRHNFTTGRRNPWNQAYGGYGTWTHESGNSINQYFGNAGIDNSPYIGVTSSATPRNVWNIICSTRDGANQKWYLNATLTSTTANPYGTLANTAANITIGSGYAGYWQGDMAVVLAYNRAISATEVQQLFDKYKGRYGL